MMKNAKIKIIVLLCIALFAIPGFAIFTLRPTGQYIQMKSEYQYAEMVIPQLIIPNTMWVFVYGEGAAFDIYKLQGDEWVKLHGQGPPQEIQFCIDGVLYNHTTPVNKSCVPLGTTEMHWYPLHWQQTQAYCGNDSYGASYMGLANPGVYKIRFELYSNGCTNEPLILEKNFTVVSGPAKT